MTIMAIVKMLKQWGQIRHIKITPKSEEKTPIISNEEQ